MDMQAGFSIVDMQYLKAQSHRACDPATDNRREVAEVAARFYKGRNKIAARSAIGCCS